jgi:hypothetical protein
MEGPQQEAQNNTNLVDCLSTGLQYIPTDRYVRVFCRMTGHPPPAQQHDNEIWGSHNSQYIDNSLMEMVTYSLVDKTETPGELAASIYMYHTLKTGVGG